VPGTDLSDEQADLKLLICCFYGVFAMVVIGTMASTIATVVKRNVVKLAQNIKNTLSCEKKTISDSQKERQEMIKRIKQLKQFEGVFEAKTRKVHVLG
jgi:hypothetical protein